MRSLSAPQRTEGTPRQLASRSTVSSPGHELGADRSSKLGVILAVGILELALFAPFLRPGTLLLLDYSDYPVGPHAELGSTAWGFAPWLTHRAPVNAALLSVFQVLPWGPMRLLPLLAVPVLVAWGFHRLLGRRTLATVGATVLFVVNPFLYERLVAGQIYLVLGVALLPLFVSVLLSTPHGMAAPVGGGLLFALLIALSPHFVFLAGLLLLVTAASQSGRIGIRRALAHAGVTLGVTLLASIYWILPIIGRASSLQRVTESDLQTFQTTPDPAFGLQLNIAGLYGFWRPGWPLPKESIPAWPLLLAAIILVAVVGFQSADRDRVLARTLLIAGVLGFMLAAGAEGPTGTLYRALFEHLPGFRIMREPAKFEAMFALAYATFFGLGVRAVVGNARSYRAKAFVLVTILALPCAYTFREFWGFGGYARPSSYPASWAEADAIMGSGPGNVLALPGDLYVPFRWTQDRTVASPIDSFFRRDVLIDGRLDLGSVESQTSDARSRYLRFTTAHGPEISWFGNLVAPLGVKYIALIQTSGWERFGWLARQDDIRLIGSWPDLRLFQNLAFTSEAYAPHHVVHLRDWGEVIGLGEHVPLTRLGVTVVDPGPGLIRAPAVQLPGEPAEPLEIRGSSPVHMDIDAADIIAVDEPYDPMWRLDGRAPAANLGVTMLFSGVRSGAVARLEYGRWPLVRVSYQLSLVAILLALAGAAVTRRRARRRAGS